jgi:hypothetical protein
MPQSHQWADVGLGSKAPPLDTFGVEAPKTEPLREYTPNMEKCKVVQIFPMRENRN